MNKFTRRDAMRAAAASTILGAGAVTAAAQEPKEQPAIRESDKPVRLADLRAARFEVYAHRKWQDTGVDVIKDKGVIIWADNAYINRWRISPAVYCGPEGDSRYIAKPGYALEGRYEGGLIAKVGNTVEFIGAKGTIIPPVNGRLFLIANDDLEGLYGKGFADNAFSVVVLIAPLS
ncbi:MAG TPA: hypothetical protein PKC45_14840 [Gemmatales bacterium]|nr:hypothetical protein [Gemmatales bacterium]